MPGDIQGAQRQKEQCELHSGPFQSTQCEFFPSSRFNSAAPSFNSAAGVVGTRWPFEKEKAGVVSLRVDQCVFVSRSFNIL